MPGFDLTFCAPKSVSVLWGLGDRETSASVRVAHDLSFDAALRYLEDQACWSRRDTNGSVKMRRDGFVAAAFRHRTSRAGDPHLHTHVDAANATRSADGRWEHSTRVTSTCTPRPPATSTRRTYGTSPLTDSVSRGHRSSTASPTSDSGARSTSSKSWTGRTMPPSRRSFTTSARSPKVMVCREQHSVRHQPRAATRHVGNLDRSPCADARAPGGLAGSGSTPDGPRAHRRSGDHPRARADRFVRHRQRPTDRNRQNPSRAVVHRGALRVCRCESARPTG